MRNLKRALSLALASIMLLGLMVVGASAKGVDDFSDSAEIVNQDAATITTAIGIFDGYEDGSFKPTNTVTRAQMAVIIAKILYGADVNVEQFKGQQVFNDVPDWCEGYVNLCASLGIIAGVGNNQFDPNSTVTTAQAALMLCRAIGYFKNEAELGDSYILAATAKASSLHMYDGLNNLVATQGLSRDDVAGMVFNALTKAPTVEYNSTFNMYYTTGADWAGGVKFDYTETLGYKNFRLVYMSKDADAFGRPCVVWGTTAKALGSGDLDADGNIDDDYTGIADKDVILSAIETPTQQWTSKVTHEALYRAAGSKVVSDYANDTNGNWDVYVDGEQQNYDPDDLDKDEDDWCFLRTTSGDKNVTGNGVLTQLFVDDKNKEVTITVVRLYAAEVRTVKDGVITLTDLENAPVDSSGAAVRKNSDEFESDAFSAGDIVYYTYDVYNRKIESVTLADKLEGEVTRVRVNTNDSDGDNFVVSGTTYSYNKTMDTEEDGLKTANVGNKVVAYLDEYGYVIYVDEASITYDYAYVLSVGTSNTYGDDTYSGRLLLSDGTVVRAELEGSSGYSDVKTQLENHIVSYSKDSSGVYTLTNRSTQGGIKAANTLKIETGVASMKNFSSGNYTANSNTVFVLADKNGSNKVDDWDFTVYTGIKNVPDIDGNGKDTRADVATGPNGGAAEFVFIEGGDVSGGDKVIFVEAKSDAKLNRDTEIGNYYNLNAVVDGQVVTLNVKESATAAVDALVKNIGGTRQGKAIVALKSYNENSDGLVTSVRLYEELNDDEDGVVSGVGTEKYSRGNIELKSNGTAYGVSDDVVVVRYSTSGKFSVSSASSIIDDDDDKVLLVLDGSTVTGICILEVRDGRDNGATPSIPVTDKVIVLPKDNEVTVPTTGPSAGVATIDDSLLPATADKPIEVTVPKKTLTDKGATALEVGSQDKAVTVNLPMEAINKATGDNMTVVVESIPVEEVATAAPDAAAVIDVEIQNSNGTPATVSGLTTPITITLTKVGTDLPNPPAVYVLSGSTLTPFDGTVSYNSSANGGTITLTTTHLTRFVVDSNPATSAEEEVTVTFEAGTKPSDVENLPDVPGAQNVKKGEKAAAPTNFTVGGYTVSWTVKGVTPEKVWNFDTDTVTEDVTLVAKYTKAPVTTFTVSFNSNGGSTVEAITNVASGATITKPTDPTKENNAFAGWFKDENLTSEWNFANDTVSADTILYAKWTPTFTVSFNSNGGSNVDSINVESGAKITNKPNNPTKADHTFAGWFKDEDLTSEWNFETDTVTTNTTLYAKWYKALPEDAFHAANLTGGNYDKPQGDAAETYEVTSAAQTTDNKVAVTLKATKLKVTVPTDTTENPATTHWVGAHITDTAIDTLGSNLKIKTSTTKEGIADETAVSVVKYGTGTNESNVRWYLGVPLEPAVQNGDNVKGSRTFFIQFFDGNDKAVTDIIEVTMSMTADVVVEGSGNSNG